MSDKYIIDECNLIFKESGVVGCSIPAHIGRLESKKPMILIHQNSGITMQQAQAICDLLNNWKDK